MGTMLATRKFFVPNRTNVKLVDSFLRSVAVWLQPCSVAACPKSYYSSKSGRIGCFMKAASLSRRYYSSDPKKESVSEPKNESSSDRNQRLTVDFCEGSRRLERPNRQSLELLLNDVQPAELQAELRGRILSILEQSDHNEEKAYQATERAKEAEVKLISAHKKLLVLAIRSRIEDLLKRLLWPSSVKRPLRRRDQFREILTSENEHFTSHANVIEFRKLFKTSGFTLEFFLDTMDDLYGEFSDRAAHNVPFPEVVTTEYIEDMFRHLGIIPDRSRVVAVELILKPLPFNTPKRTGEEEEN